MKTRYSKSQVQSHDSRAFPNAISDLPANHLVEGFAAEAVALIADGSAVAVAVVHSSQLVPLACTETWENRTDRRDADWHKWKQLCAKTDPLSGLLLTGAGLGTKECGKARQQALLPQMQQSNMAVSVYQASSSVAAAPTAAGAAAATGEDYR